MIYTDWELLILNENNSSEKPAFSLYLLKDLHTSTIESIEIACADTKEELIPIVEALARTLKIQLGIP